MQFASAVVYWGLHEALLWDESLPLSSQVSILVQWIIWVQKNFTTLMLLSGHPWQEWKAVVQMKKYRYNLCC